MLVNDNDALKRLNSPLNLINKMRGTSEKRGAAMSLFGINKINNQRSETKSTPEPTSFNPFPKSTTSVALVPVTEDKPQEQSNPSIDDLVSTADKDIKLTQAHDKALETLISAVDQMKLKLDDIKPDKLPSVISATSKVVESIRKERNEAAKGKTQDVHFHFYTPEQKRVDDYEVIDVG